jgi:transcriptional regulator with XRE-family HTH domain
MAKPFKNLVDKMSPESRERIRKRTAAMYSEMALQELRQAMHLTQQELAEVLKMNQAAISKLEHQSDMYVSTLRRFIAAMGGELRIIAHFPQGDVEINQFDEIRKHEPAEATAD